MGEKPKITFVILSPEPNIGRLKGTIRSIKNNYREDAEMVCVVGRAVNKEIVAEMKLECPVFKGGDTITSLMNTGLKNSNGWCLFVIEGAIIPKSIESRYFKWINNEKDVLFPIVVTYNIQGEPIKILSTFADCTLNGMLIHKKLFDEVGKFTDNPIKVSKEFWALDATCKGAFFKAILGVKIC